MSSLKKKNQVVMLPTEKAENCLVKSGNIIYNFKPKYLFTQSYLKEIYGKAYHLYILSDDEIKEGDWFIKMNYKGGKPTLYQECKKAFMNSEWLNSSDVNDCFKVIATTDKLVVGYIQQQNSEIDIVQLLPQPSQQFIAKYIEDNF